MSQHQTVGGLSGGLFKERKRATGKKYDICLVEELPDFGESRATPTVVGTAFEREDGMIRAVFKPGISVAGSLDFRPVSVESSNPNS